ncbi:hemerythrin domain-containing protein [Aestuariimicrobium soli]|uniref:hemerythrin domain-containing protein n=1 Tax=Aestuariimicrobium soli TaxID=2035834 RepID=UPI003EBE6FF6
MIGRFMDEHVEIINATGDLRRAVEGGDADECRRGVEAVAGLLGPHTGAEEVGLFSVMKKQDEFVDYVTQLCGEHVGLDDLLECVATEPDPTLRHQVFDLFEDALRAHIDREDNSLFPAAAVSLVGPDWDEIDTLTHEYDHGTGRAHAHEPRTHEPHALHD